jgi:hypothetical protein
LLIAFRLSFAYFCQLSLIVKTAESRPNVALALRKDVEMSRKDVKIYLWSNNNKIQGLLQ